MADLDVLVGYAPRSQIMALPSATLTKLLAEPLHLTETAVVVRSPLERALAETLHIVQTAAPVAQLINPGSPTFFDDFNYAVARGSSAAGTTFNSQGGWAQTKCNGNADNAVGQEGGGLYLYTVTSIPDLSLAWPNGVARALCIECPVGVASQTDSYLQLGGGANYIPGNVWFQWWQLTAATATQPSQIHTRNKWLYPTQDTYPSNSNRWMLQIGNHSSNPFNVAPYGNPSDGEQFLVIRDHFVGTPLYALADSGDEDKLGHTTISEYLVPNRWNLIKIHFNTSTASNNSFEAWIKAYGGSFVKVAEWIGGTTPNFTWTQADSGGGHSQLRIPTTIPGNNVATFYPQWTYLQDFAMATSEAALPTY